MAGVGANMAGKRAKATPARAKMACATAPHVASPAKVTTAVIGPRGARDHQGPP